MGEHWQNWAGSVACEPREIRRPCDESGVIEAVARASALDVSLRVVGTGHSFSPIVATDGVLVSLDGHAGIASIDAAQRRAVVRAGTKLHALGEPLLEAGLAMETMGDVDVQALSGAVATGTHGTGRTLRNIPSQIHALRVILASGEPATWSSDDDRETLDAARISLGMLGVTSEITLQLVPAYCLHEITRRVPIDECLAGLEAEIAAHRHFEFWWYPGKDVAETKSLDSAPAPDPLPERKYERVDWSARVLPSVRELRFNEMEYSIPAEDGPACFRAVRERVRSRHPDVVWPVEYRTIAGDDAWLSTAYRRATVTISLHQDARIDAGPFFHDIEPIFVEHHGRPHWGKVHTRTADYLSRVYSRFEDFRALRTRLDPAGRFLTPYLRTLFDR